MQETLNKNLTNEQHQIQLAALQDSQNTGKIIMGLSIIPFAMAIAFAAMRHSNIGVNSLKDLEPLRPVIYIGLLLFVVGSLKASAHTIQLKRLKKEMKLQKQEKTKPDVSPSPLFKTDKPATPKP